MIKVFDNIHAECEICGTPLWGENLLRRGNKFYCQSDYEKTSPEEKAENKRIEDESNFLKNILKAND